MEEGTSVITHWLGLRRVITVSLLAAACASIEAPRGTWYVDAPDFRMTSYEWVVIDDRDPEREDERLEALCWIPRDRDVPGLHACALRVPGGHCLVYSDMTEKEAKRTFTKWGDTYYDHEIKGHCGGGTGPGKNHGP